MEKKRFGLYFKRSVSRGRNSYGYNICSLWIRGKKVSSCNGGGYDMKGVAFAMWVKKEFQTELIALAKKEIKKENTYHGMSIDKKTEGKRTIVEKVSLDGACGFECICRIAEAIGYKTEFITYVDNGGTVYLFKNF